MPEIEGSGSPLEDVIAQFDKDAQAQKEAMEEADRIKASTTADSPAATTEDAPAESAEAAPTAPQTYVVQAGDSLSAISEKVYGDSKYWETIFNHNRDKITDPNLIHPGQELTIP